MDKNESRMERKKEKTKQQVIDAAMALFKERGVEASSMEEIAQKADIAKGTLYSYFPVKEAIISAYMKRSFEQKKDERIAKLAALPDTRSRIRALFLELLQGVQANRELFEKYLIYHMQQMVSFHTEQEKKSGLNLLILSIVEQGRQQKELRDDLPVSVLEELLEFVFIQLIKQAFLKTAEDEKTLEDCIGLFMKGAGVQA
jgi:AcrR family transcriptional regulator